MLIEGDFAGGDGTILRGAGGSGPAFSGVYIPNEPAVDPDITLTFVQLPGPIPVPCMGWLLLLAGLVGLPWLAGVRH